ncbi:hypothetical protein ACFRMQ_04500 [Kitasatospora sp. NPDC056783]|uniref:hypothetical protein n=1 Tax=Kitasatospora sp. NPDC056783 TaxID=3345943 RepID=UPI00369077B9
MRDTADRRAPATARGAERAERGRDGALNGRRLGPGLVLPLVRGHVPTEDAQRQHVAEPAGLLRTAFRPAGTAPERRARAEARARLRELCGLPAAGSVDWEEVRSRVPRAMNYAGMPAVLREVFGEAERAMRGPRAGAGFRTSTFD